MNINQRNVLIIAFITIILIIGIMQWAHYLIENKFIIECFTSYDNSSADKGDPDTSHTVNLPINTTFQCSNMCGPLSRCSKTGEQCTSDIDCYGCKPIIVDTEPEYVKENAANLRGNNGAGKLTDGQTPTYSPLTTDIGTKAKFVNGDPNNRFTKAPQYNFGVDLWSSYYNAGMDIFNDRYEPKDLEFLPTYPKRYNLSGVFVDNGPLASNAYL